MAFNNLTGLAVSHATKFLRESKEFAKLNNSVVDFGNQRFRLSNEVISYIEELNSVSINAPAKEPKRSEFTTSFYHQLGYKHYLAIDMNAKLGAIQMDLNTDLKSTYRFTHQYSLVIDNGTGEHIFDQHMVFKNQHELCEVGGIILNCKPFFPWINHGFFTFQPVLFRDLAYANNYEHVFTWLGGNHGEYIDVTGNDEIWIENPRTKPFWRKPKNTLENLIFDRLLDRNNISIIVAYRKTSTDAFKVPLQGKWIHNIDDQSLKEKYGDQPDTYKQYHS